MTRFTSVTPNLACQDLMKSLAFYRDTLGFKMGQTVPETVPYVFAMLDRDGVPVFLNDIKAIVEEHPDMAKTPFGGTGTLYFLVTGIDELHDAVKGKTPIVMALKTQFYGMREFAVKDPDGHLLTFAERVSG